MQKNLAQAFVLQGVGVPYMVIEHWCQQFLKAMLSQILPQYMKKITAFLEIVYLDDWTS